MLKNVCCTPYSLNKMKKYKNMVQNVNQTTQYFHIVNYNCVAREHEKEV